MSVKRVIRDVGPSWIVKLNVWNLIWLPSYYSKLSSRMVVDFPPHHTACKATGTWSPLVTDVQTGQEL